MVCLFVCLLVLIIYLGVRSKVGREKRNDGFGLESGGKVGLDRAVSWIFGLGGEPSHAAFNGVIVVVLFLWALFLFGAVGLVLWSRTRLYIGALKSEGGRLLMNQ